MTYMPGMGDPDACEAAANACDRAASQLYGPINQLSNLRMTVLWAWQGEGGDSLASAIGDRVPLLEQAQSDLRDAARSLRWAASDIRDAIRRADEERRRQQQQEQLQQLLARR